YGVGMVFLPRDAEEQRAHVALMEWVIGEEGQKVLGWRDVSVDNKTLGESVKACEPVIRQVFIARGEKTKPDAFERKLFVIRKVIEHRAKAEQPKGASEFYIPSFSSRTLVYKGMFLAPHVGAYYRDLSDERVVTALALVHQRFSTNTFPSW